MKLLFSHKGKYARIADKDRMIFAVDDSYYDVTGTQVPEEPGFRSNASAWDSDDDDPWARVTAAEQGLDEPLLSESVEEIVWEIDDGFGKFGFKNRNGEFVIEPQYAYAHEFTCGLACVNLNRTWYHTPEGRRYYENHYGYINHRGETVIQFKYDEAWPFNKYGVAVVEDLREGAYLIDTAGREVPGTRFPYLSHYYDYDDRFLEFSYERSGEDLVGIYDTKERKVLLEPSIDDIIEWDEEHICVYERNGEFGISDFKQRYINSKGEDIYPWLSAQRFATIERPNKDGIAIVAVSKYTELAGNPSSFFPHNGKKYERVFLHGLYTKDEQYLLPLEYEKISEIGENIFACYKDGIISVYTID